MSSLSLEQLLEALSPRVLRETCELPFARARETFTPRFSASASHAAVMAEVVRFVQHLYTHIYLTRGMWPRDLAEATTEELVTNACPQRGGPMRIVDRAGMRGLCDTLTAHLQQRRLHAYIDGELVLPFRLLSIPEQFALVRAYRDCLRDDLAALATAEFEHHAILWVWWRDILLEHARLVLARR